MERCERPWAGQGSGEQPLALWGAPLSSAAVTCVGHGSGGAVGLAALRGGWCGELRRQKHHASTSPGRAGSQRGPLSGWQSGGEESVFLFMVFHPLGGSSSPSWAVFSSPFLFFPERGVSLSSLFSCLSASFLVPSPWHWAPHLLNLTPLSSGIEYPMASFRLPLHSMLDG